MPRFEPLSHRTSAAEILLVEPGWIEQRYLSEAQFSPEVVEENQGHIDRLSAGSPFVQLNVFPAGMRVNLPLMDRDHFREKREGNLLRALAIVTDSEEMRTATNIYFFYHHQLFAVEVFEEEYDARIWLREHLQRLA